MTSPMRRNLLLLATCQALGQAANTMMFAATALSVATFLPQHRELATLPVTMQHLGVMLAVFPTALLMQRMGRGFGFRLGSLTGVVGATICGLGLVMGSIAVMCLGGLIQGYAVASVQMYRFAAVELVPGHMRAKAISWVTAGGIAAGIIGPSVVRLTYDTLVPLYLGTYVAMMSVHVIVFAVMWLIRFPAIQPGETKASTTGEQRPLWQIATQPQYAVAVMTAMIAFGTMSFLMSASPLAIVACGLPQTEAHFVIFVHVMGMFVPSLFTGNLIHRYGTMPIMTAGGAILILGIVPALMGVTEWHFRISLTLVGLGWNFMFIGATTLVTTTYRAAERGKAQALNDFLIFGTTAIASFLAGYLEEKLGWASINWIGLVMVVLALAGLAWLNLGRRKPAPA
ncbi:MAG: MFS transporter [Acetobacteraceae bacterium]|nr:MFS transporter [Acetobacteraceae bacterium]